MYTAEYGLAAIAVAMLAMLNIPLYSHLRSSNVPWTQPPVDNTVGGLVKRVVVIVIDGLRYDLYEPGSASSGALVHTGHVNAPTESRPAHAQLLCGVDEDPRGIFNNWQGFPEGNAPDSVLRRAPFAVAIGGPDVVPYFVGRHVYTDTFNPAMYKEQGTI